MADAFPCRIQQPVTDSKQQHTIRSPRVPGASSFTHYMAVYLICLDKPICRSRHYIGYAEDIEARFAVHKSGQGAKFLAAANEYGINYSVVRVWPEGDRKFERKLKNQKGAADYCPHCRAAAKEKRNAWQRAKYHKKKADESRVSGT